MLSSVLLHPSKQLLIAHTAVCNRKPDLHKLLVTAFKLDSVNLKERQHNINADAFIAIDKCVIGYKCISKTCSLFFL